MLYFFCLNSYDGRQFAVSCDLGLFLLHKINFVLEWISTFWLESNQLLLKYGRKFEKRTFNAGVKGM